MRKEKVVPFTERKKRFAFGLLLTGFLAFFFIPGANAETAKQSLVLDVVPSVQVEEVNYFFKNFKGKETIHVVVKIKNISQEAKRFKVLVSIEDGPSSACYYPRAGKPPVIKPGDSHAETMPLVFYQKPPTDIMIKVTEM